MPTQVEWEEKAARFAEWMQDNFPDEIFRGGIFDAAKTLLEKLKRERDEAMESY